MKSSTTAFAIAVLFGGALVMAATMIPSCHKANNPGSGRTFYDSLGGTTPVADPANFGQTVEQGYLAIRTIVDTALLIIQADTTINSYFSIMVNEDTLHETPTEYDKLSLNITNFLAVAAGAQDYSYSGPDLFAAHNPDSNANIPAPVDSAAFNEFAHDLALSARQHGLSYQLISQLGKILYRYESEVVQP
ncbi:MAG TPA: hypothetical protein VMH27_08375 [Puia sp.]|nr:hypothetical protein [Puia sp.]